jgi:dienelactone hydrolase
MLQAVLRQALTVWLASTVAAGCSTSVVRFPNATPHAPRAISGWLSRPAGPGPFPAIVLLHGCAGVSVSNHEWARRFVERGYAALIVDSWTPRGMTDGCGPETDIPNTERFDDTVGALRFLHARAWIDRARIGVIGWSNGGVFSMAAINGPSHARARRRGVILPDPGFQAGVGVYPGGCYSLVQETVVRPLLVLIGDADDWTIPGPCLEMGENMRQRGADVTVVVYPGAVHYFDVEQQPRSYLPEVANRNKPGECCGATVGYDPAAAADAHRRVAEFFGYHLLRKR